MLVYIDAKDAAGKAVRWGGELTSPNRLARMGGTVKWHKDLLKPGDKITMTGRPARNGAPAMVITQIVDAPKIARASVVIGAMGLLLSLAAAVRYRPA